MRQKERLLAANVAQIGVAQADIYPRFTLEGMFGFHGVNDILEWSKRSWTFGGDFIWRLFDCGKTKSIVEREYAKAEQAYFTYRQTLVDALEETETAMRGFREEKKRKEYLTQSVLAAKNSVDIVSHLYKAGLTNFENVLEMEKSLFEQQDLKATSEGAEIIRLIDLYKSLGGCFQPCTRYTH